MPGPQESFNRRDMAARKGQPGVPPMMVDPVAQMVDALAQNAQALAEVFNEKTKRVAEENKHLPPQEQPLPDLSELKHVIDAQAKAIEMALAYREEQRRGMMFSASYKPRTEKDEGTIGFGDADKAKKTKTPPAAQQPSRH